MRKAWTFLAGLLLTASIASAAAGDAPMGTIRGQVSTIDAASGSLIVKLDPDQGDRQGEMSFFVTGDAKIVRAGDAIALAQIKKGDKVTITYRPTDERNVVVNIGVESSKT
jgi:Cu/Ag efflux protein CusF